MISIPLTPPWGVTVRQDPTEVNFKAWSGTAIALAGEGPISAAVGVIDHDGKLQWFPRSQVRFDLMLTAG